MGKVKSRVSSILPDSISKWFSPGTTAEGNSSTRQADNDQSPQQQQQNGSALAVKRKRSRRRIELEVEADEPDLMDDGIDAQELNDEEVQLADNIAEHDLAAEDEQTRRNEYNVSLLRKRQQALAVAREHNNNDNDEDDDDDDDDVEEEEDDDEQDDADLHQIHGYHPNRSTALGLKVAKPNTNNNNNNINNNAATGTQQQQPPPKRTRFEVSYIVQIIYISIISLDHK